MVRRILITGANKGIGLAITTRCLLDNIDTHIIMACRSSSRANTAMSDLITTNPEWKDRIMVLEMDTSSDTSVQVAAASLESKLVDKKTPTPLYGIVNNAGIVSGTVTEVLNVNVRGPKRVDDAFLHLLDPETGRIVQMSSGSASGCVSSSSTERQTFFTDPTVTWEQIEAIIHEVEAYPNGAKELDKHGIGGGGMGVYGLSKALLNSYTMMLARYRPMLKVNSCSPGMIATDIFGSVLPWWVPIPNSLVRFLAVKAMGAKTPDEGTLSTMHLLFSDDGIEGNGRYYGSDAKRSPLDTYRSPGSPPYDGP